MSEKERFQKRKNTVKIVWNVLFLISAIITIILVSLAINDKEVIYYEYLEEYGYYTKDKYIVPLYLFGTWDIFCIVFWLCSLVGVKFHSYSYQGHEISVYLGWSCAYLLLDDAVVDKHTGSFFGARPLECDLNGERVNLKVGTLTLNNYTLRVGNKILH
ncbi:MAG: hypothetical protein NC037_02420 [Bacteroides sp.]|nr:hypothetical protein [Bacillota bacterium]MCM1455369.1 hypothetical protein [Bacteroides sp.]